MTVVRSIVLFVGAALLEIGGGWLVWQGWREHRAWVDRRRRHRPGRHASRSPV